MTFDHLLALIAALAAAGAVVLGGINKAKLNELHISVNSRLTELLEQKGKASHAEGVVQGIAEAKKDN